MKEHQTPVRSAEGHFAFAIVSAKPPTIMWENGEKQRVTTQELNRLEQRHPSFFECTARRQ